MPASSDDVSQGEDGSPPKAGAKYSESGINKDFQGSIISDSDYSSEFSEVSFWSKLKSYAQQSGKDVVEAALKLFYVWQDPDTPSSAKVVIVGALVYFIVPTDAVFDLLPGGYVDDWGAMMGALWTVAAHIKPAHVEQAREKLTDWFERTAE